MGRSQMPATAIKQQHSLRVSDYKALSVECQAAAGKNSAEIKAQLFFATLFASVTALALLAANLTQQFKGVTVGINEGVIVGTGTLVVAPALGYNPVAYQIAIDSDDQVIVLFLPAHNQGSVTVQ